MFDQASVVIGFWASLKKREKNINAYNNGIATKNVIYNKS